MSAGQPRKTQQALVLSGADKYNAKRYENYNLTETGPVIPKDTVLKCPKEYSKETKKAWKSIVPSLISMGVLSEQDLVGLKIMFDVYEEYLLHCKTIKHLDETYSSEEDYWDKRDKASKRKDRAFDQWLRIACRYGILPTERSRLLPQKLEKKEEDPLAIILGE